MGIVFGQASYNTSEDILSDADIALYQAKEAGGNTYEVFDGEMKAMVLQRIQLENDLKWAVESRAFILHYQPIYNLRSGELHSFEALVRWQKNSGELVYPGDFIKVAEKSINLNFLLWKF